MFQTKVVEKIKTYILYSVTFFFENRAVYGITWSRRGHRWQYDVCSLHAGYL